jgi:multiple sugar transport system substrate-binding protein
MNKRILLVVVTLLIVLAMVAGCSPQQPTTTQPAAEEPAAPAEPTAAAAPAATTEPAPAPAATGDRVQVRWYIGLGTGHNPEQLEAQQAVVEAFNSSQDEVELIMEIVQNDQAYDTLQTQIAAGNAPDIVGPVGVRGLNGFREVVADLSQYADSGELDLSQYPEPLVEFWQQGGKLVGVPFAVYPSFIYYNRDLFDEAGLPYPPEEWGPDVEYDGQPWNMETFRELAMQLTVDSSGNDATEAGFDPQNIVQFGFVPQWGDDPRAEATFFGAGSVVDEQGDAQVPDHWREAWNWMYQGMWEDWFIPNGIYTQSELFPGGNAFDSGNVGMAFTHLWYTCCINPETVPNWGIASLPAYNGEVTAKLHADTFVMLEGSRNPEAALLAYRFLTEEAQMDLLQAYGGLPPQEERQADFFAGLDEKFAPNEVNWEVAQEALNYPDIPSHEADMPDFLRADDVIKTFGTLYHTTADLDMNQAIDELQGQLRAVFEQGQ